MRYRSILALSLPLGIFTIAVLHDNNTVDIATDRASGIKTLPMLIGERASVKLFLAYMVIPYVVVIGFCIAGLLPWMSLVCLISAPVAYKNARAAYGWFGKGREAMIGLDQKTAQVHLIFSVLLSAGPTVALVVTTIVYALVFVILPI